MFCESCGRVLNRTTGQCVCAEPAVAAVASGADQAAAGGWAPLDASAAAADATAEVGTTTAVATVDAPGAAATPAVPAGWYPDPYAQAAHRWWDGAQWTGHVAPSVAPAGGGHARWDRGGGNGGGDVGDGPDGQGGATWVAALPRVARWWRSYDLYVFEDRLVFTKLPMSWVVVLGMFTGGLLGWLLASTIAASSSRQRIAARRGATASQLGGLPGSISIPTATAGPVRARAYLTGGSIRFAASGRRHRFNWVRGATSDDEVEHALRGAFGSRLTFKRMSPARQVVGVIVGGLLAVRLLIRIITIPFAMFGAVDPGVPPATPAVAPAAVPHLERGCSLVGSVSPGTPTEQIVATLGEARGAFVQAAAADAQLLDASNAVMQLQAFFQEALAGGNPSEEGVRAAGDKIDAACALAYGEA